MTNDEAFHEGMVYVLERLLNIAKRMNRNPVTDDYERGYKAASIQMEQNVFDVLFDLKRHPKPPMEYYIKNKSRVE